MEYPTIAIYFYFVCIFVPFSYDGYAMFQFETLRLSFAHKEGFASSPKDEFEKHMHHFYEVIFFCKGEVEFHLEEGSRHLMPGDVVLIGPGKYHFAEVNRNTPYERYVCKFGEDALSDSLRCRLSAYPPFFPNAESLLPLLEELDARYEEYSEDEMEDLCKAKIVEFLLRLSKVKTETGQAKSSPFLRQTIDYIDAHIHEDLTSAKLAKGLHYSTSYLSKRFREEMKVPLMGFIRGKKIMACHTLIKNGAKAQEAAFAMGFQDYSTFYRAYKRLLGTKPSLT